MTRTTALWMAVVAGLVSGCSSTVPLKNPPELDALIKAYEESSQKDVAADTRLADRIRNLSVKGSSMNDAVVDADLVNAPVDEVVSRMLAAARTSVVYRAGAPAGLVTAQMHGLPLLRALNLALHEAGLEATVQTDVVVIDHPTSPAAPNTTTTHARVQLRWMDTTAATTLLTSLSGGQSPPAVEFGVLPSTNSVVLVGPADAVQRVIDMLHDLDRETPHVIIEALVVEFDRDAFERYGIDITNGAYKRYSGVNATFGSLFGGAITFTRSATAQNVKAFTAIIDLLASQDRARLLSRPYIATLSGLQASVNITRNRYVIVQSAQNGATVATPQAVPSGVVLTITPTVTVDGMIRTNLNVQDSQFIPTTENVAVETDQNQASTTMQVRDGESIIIGGLALDRTSSSKAGAPLLSRIPLLNLLFSDQNYSRTQQEVMVIVTPHLWHPGMEVPLREPAALKPTGE